MLVLGMTTTGTLQLALLLRNFVDKVKGEPARSWHSLRTFRYCREVHGTTSQCED